MVMFFPLTFDVRPNRIPFGFASGTRVYGEVSGQLPDRGYFMSAQNFAAPRSGPSRIRRVPTALSATHLRSGALELRATPVLRPPIGCP